MIKIKFDEKGVTLIELLIVLSIAILLSTIMMSVSYKWLHRKNENDALERFISSIYTAQIHAMAHQEANLIIFGEDDNGSFYSIRTTAGQQILKEYFPEGMQLASDSALKRLGFHPNGDMRETGSLTLSTSQSTIKIVFQFLRGRMIIHEPKRLLTT